MFKALLSASAMVKRIKSYTLENFGFIVIATRQLKWYFYRIYITIMQTYIQLMGTLDSRTILFCS